MTNVTFEMWKLQNDYGWSTQTAFASIKDLRVPLTRHKTSAADAMHHRSPHPLRLSFPLNFYFSTAGVRESRLRETASKCLEGQGGTRNEDNRLG